MADEPAPVSGLLVVEAGGQGLDMRRAAIALVLAAIATPSLPAQEAAPPRLTFEVATVKRNLSLDQRADMRVDPGGRFRAVNAPAMWLIAMAYGEGFNPLRPDQISGQPGWFESEHYDINAKGASEATTQAGNPFDGQIRQMLQALIEDRFKLRVHREKRRMPVYILVRARADGALGPRFKPVTPDCFKGTIPCGFPGGPPGLIRTGAITMDLLAQLLANAADRIVIDRTGLTGGFKIDLEYSPDQTASDKPSIFTAVQEQLGLKLESAREPVDVLVIDHVERPTED